MPWHWKDRLFPDAYLEVSRHGEAPDSGYELIENVYELYLFKNESKVYTYVDSGDSFEPCSASGSGGYIEVVCDTKVAGRLVVTEYTISGWKAWRDGERVRLVGAEWLGVEAPTGKHTYIFRYLPWDVPVSLFLLAAGIVLCVSLWRNPDQFPLSPTIVRTIEEES